MSAPKTRQFSLLSTVTLTTAVAFWCWLFNDLPAFELALFSGTTLIAGLIGHFTHEFVLRSRITVLATALLLYNVSLLILGSLSSMSLGDSLEMLKDLIVEPAMLVQRTNGILGRLFSLSIVAGTVLLTPAHSIRPCLPTAIMTAMGPGIWYSAGLLCLMHAG